MTREVQNSTERIKVVALNSSAAGVTGATLTLTIRRDSDGQYWSGTAFQAGIATVAMTETDATNFAGYYHYDFNTTGLADGVYTLKITSATAAVINDPWKGELKIGGWVDDAVTARKYVRNRIVFSGSNYTVYEDDEITPFETGTISVTERNPA